MDTNSSLAIRGRALRVGLQLVLLAEIGSAGALAASGASDPHRSPVGIASQNERSVKEGLALNAGISSTNKRRSDTGRAGANSSKSKKRPGTKQKAAIAKRQSTLRRPVTGQVGADPGNSEQARIDVCRQQIDREMQPARLVKLAEACERDLPGGPFSDELRRVAIGAKSAMEVQKLAGLSAEVFADQSGDRLFREAIGKAVRGDKEAAYELAQLFRNGQVGTEPNLRRMEQWLRFSAELGNGRASWELAEHYNYIGLIADAARFEKRAIEQGYQPAVRLPSRGY